MKFKKKISLYVLLILSIVILSSINVLSWNSHYFYTELALALKNNDWVNDFPEIEVTPYTYEEIDRDEYNPEFVIKYVDEEIGGKVRASNILIKYSDEPDWDLDTNLQLNKMQSLTGGSQGYRHMYFSVFGGLLKAGVAPQRANHFFEMAKVAFKKAYRPGN